MEWTGDWSYNSDKWTPETIAQTNMEIADDGIFWMCLEDFVARIISVHICNYVEGHNFTSIKTHEHDNKDGWHIFSVVLDTEGDHTFSVSQVDKLCIPKDRIYKYSTCRLIIVKLINGFNFDDGVIYIDGKQDSWERDYYLICEGLLPGTYMAFVEFDWHECVLKEKNSFCVTNYGPGNTEFKEVTEEYSREQYLRLAFIAKLQQKGS